MKIELGKQYKTRDGREVRILMTDGGDWQWPVIAAYKDRDGNWWPLHCTKDGRVTGSYNEDPRDLIEVKRRIKRRVWVNVYRHDDGAEFVELHDRRDHADGSGGTARVACVKLTIDCEEGEGL